MKKIALIFTIVLLPLSVNAALTEKECQSQAKAAEHVLSMMENGSIPKDEEKIAKYKQAKAHIEKGEYCAARKIVLNIERQGSEG